MRRLTIASLFLFSGTAFSGVVERVAAVVNDEVIALSEIYEIGGEYIAEALSQDTEEETRRRAELEVLEELVSQELMVQEMLRLGVMKILSDHRELCQCRVLQCKRLQTHDFQLLATRAV